MFLVNSKLYNLFIKNFFGVKARSNRKEYIARLSMTIFSCFITKNVCKVSDLSNNFVLDIMVIIATWISILCILQIFFLNHRRLHDFNFNGWWQISVPFIPFIISIIIGQTGIVLAQTLLLSIPLFLLLPYLLFIPLVIIRGTPTTNKYGEPPND